MLSSWHSNSQHRSKNLIIPCWSGWAFQCTVSKHANVDQVAHSNLQCRSVQKLSSSYSNPQHRSKQLNNNKKGGGWHYYYNYLCIVSNNTRPTKQALKNLVYCVICSAKNSKTFSRKGGDKIENLGKNTGMIKKTSTKEKPKTTPKVLSCVSKTKRGWRNHWESSKTKEQEEEEEEEKIIELQVVVVFSMFSSPTYQADLTLKHNAWTCTQ